MTIVAAGPIPVVEDGTEARFFGRLVACSSSNANEPARFWHFVFDATASRFHPASIAGLVVGAMGAFVFGLYLRRWAKERGRPPVVGT
jgi:hypothetical protein